MKTLIKALFIMILLMSIVTFIFWISASIFDQQFNPMEYSFDTSFILFIWAMSMIIIVALSYPLAKEIK